MFLYQAFIADPHPLHWGWECHCCKNILHKVLVWVTVSASHVTIELPPRLMSAQDNGNDQWWEQHCIQMRSIKHKLMPSLPFQALWLAAVIYPGLDFCWSQGAWSWYGPWDTGHTDDIMCDVTKLSWENRGDTAAALNPTVPTLDLLAKEIILLMPNILPYLLVISALFRKYARK